MSDNLYELIRGAAPNLEKTALDADDDRSLSYAALFKRADQAANALTSYGVKPGDRVAVQIDKSPDAVVLLLACLSAGAVLLPLNPDYTLAELSYFFADAEPALVICRPQDFAAVSALARSLGIAQTASLGVQGEGAFGAAIAMAPPTAVSVARANDDLAAILYTSGTTGRAKGAMLSHGNLSSNAQSLIRQWRFSAADVLIHALPVFHTHGLFVATNVALLAGATMIFQPRFDADAIIKALPRATALMGVPTFYTRLIDHPGLTRASTAHMRLFVSGSAPLLKETHDAWRERTGHAILERYGMTETNMIASNPYEGERRSGAVGFALDGVSLRIADAASGAQLADGEIGVIEVKGPNVFKGYWRMPDKTKAEFRPDGFFITGDLGRFDEDGYLTIVGRAKDLIISGGFNIYPAEIEAEINALDGVAESAVIGLPHRDFGEAATAVVTLRAGASFDELTALTALALRLARYKLPKRILVEANLPRNAMGKVQKALLRAAHAGLYRAK